MFIVDAALEFPEAGRSFRYELPVHVAQISIQNLSLPSTMGWDLLSAFKVCVDRLNGVVSLEPHEL